MDAQTEKAVDYYDFLFFIQEVSKDANKLQKQSVMLVYDNFSSSICKNKIEKKIKNLESLLIT